MSNSAIMELEGLKNRFPKKYLDEDEDEYPGILPCQGRKEGLYPWVSLENVQDESVDSKIISFLGGHFYLAPHLPGGTLSTSTRLGRQTHKCFAIFLIDIFNTF